MDGIFFARVSAPALFVTIGCRSRTSKTLSNETRAVITSIRTFDNAVNGPYKRANKAVMASNVPTVTLPFNAK